MAKSRGQPFIEQAFICRVGIDLFRPEAGAVLVVFEQCYKIKIAGLLSGRSEWLGIK